MTVSRALRGAPRNSPETRDRIRRIAREMGYRPNPAVSALMSARAQGKSAVANLALLKVGPGKEVLGYTEGAFEQAEKYGYHIEEYILHPPEMTPERLRSILLNRGVHGIVVLPVPVPSMDLHFDFEGFAVAAIGHSVAHEHLSRVTSDTYLRTLDALKHLYQRGYKRIGIINMPGLDKRAHYGVRAAAEVAVHGIASDLKVHTFLLDVDDEYVILSSRDKERIRDWIVKHRLQVVASQLEHIPEVIEEDGFKIPEDLAYLHLHLLKDKRIACMDQMCKQVGRKAVDMVVAAINRNEFSLPEHPHVLSVPSEWRDGASVPALP